MGEVILGLETEMGTTLKSAAGARVSHKPAIDAALDLARRYLPCWLRDGSSSGLYSGNGARLYNDNHLEYATPETTNPADLVRHVLAGDRFIESVIIPGLVREYGYGEVKFYRSNACYCTGNTKGCHENYGTRNGDRPYEENLIPFLCARILFAGSGGFDARRPDIRFLSSPRLAHIETIVSESSTGGRPLVHIRNESHSGGKGRRIHIICGDSGRSAKALYRRMGMTGLVVALIDAGFEPGLGVALCDPLSAVRAFAEDPSCTAAAPMDGGGAMTAKEILCHYLEFVEAHFADLPDWAPELCANVRVAIEDELREGAASAACEIEWAMKHRIFGDFAARRGVAFDRDETWHRILRGIESIIVRRGVEATRICAKWMRALAESPEDPALPAIEALLRENGRALDGLLKYVEVRDALFELDTRWTEIGEESLYTRICRGAGLTESIPGLDPASVGAEAINTPPTTTRALVRGRMIAQHGTRDEDRKSFQCSWANIVDQGAQRLLDLTDPFGTGAGGSKWRSILPHARIREPCEATLREALDFAIRLHDRGAFEEAAMALASAAQHRARQSSVFRRQFLRYQAWVQIRRGSMAGVREALDERARVPGELSEFEHQVDLIIIHRHGGLRAPETIRPHLARGIRLIRRNRGAVPAFFSSAVYSHLGHYLTVTKGKPLTGLDYLRRGRQCGGETLHPFPRNLLFCDLARSFTLSGRRRDALYWLYKAKEICEAHGYDGERAEQVLAGLARVHGRSRSRAMRFLEEAEVFQRETRNRMGETRTLLLQSRIAGDADGRRHERIVGHRAACGVLARCALLRKILEHWDAYLRGRGDPEGIDDDFWGV